MHQSRVHLYTQNDSPGGSTDVASLYICGLRYEG